MLKVDEAWIQAAEARYPGFRATLAHYETQARPSCPTCGSAETASVSTGIIGRTMALAAATTKIKLVPNSQPANFYCGACDKFFDASVE
jgi:predicted RNA-binding Zn-ribbon protein involved in translation (DUF1610 family)